jgi:hypothetical protein
MTIPAAVATNPPSSGLTGIGYARSTTTTTMRAYTEDRGIRITKPRLFPKCRAVVRAAWLPTVWTATAAENAVSTVRVTVGKIGVKESMRPRPTPMTTARSTWTASQFQHLGRRLDDHHRLANRRAKCNGGKMKSIRISETLELAFNDAMTEVSINRTDDTCCFIDIVVQDGKLVLDYCDYGQRDCEELSIEE